MPTLVDPFTSTKIQWPPRKSGRITITGKLVPDPESPVPFPFEFPLQVTFPRDQIVAALRSPIWHDQMGRLYDAVAGSIVTMLANTAFLYRPDARDLSTFRKRTVMLRACGPPIDETRNFVCRVAVPQWLFGGYDRQLKQFFKQDGSFTGLNIELSFLLFPPNLRGYLIKPPRGRKARGWPLYDCLPAALHFAGRFIVDRELATRRRQARLSEILYEDDHCLKYVSRFEAMPEQTKQQAAIVALVDWTFRGAWDRYGVKALMEYVLPKEVFDQYLYGAPRVCVKRDWKQFSPDIQQRVTTLWIDRLLGAPGQAAKDFGLIK